MSQDCHVYVRWGLSNVLPPTGPQSIAALENALGIELPPFIKGQLAQYDSAETHQNSVLCLDENRDCFTGPPSYEIPPFLSGLWLFGSGPYRRIASQRIFGTDYLAIGYSDIGVSLFCEVSRPSLFTLASDSSEESIHQVCDKYPAFHGSVFLDLTNASWLDLLNIEQAQKVIPYTSPLLDRVFEIRCATRPTSQLTKIAIENGFPYATLHAIVSADDSLRDPASVGHLLRIAARTNNIDLIHSISTLGFSLQCDATNNETPFTIAAKQEQLHFCWALARFGYRVQSAPDMTAFDRLHLHDQQFLEDLIE